MDQKLLDLNMRKAHENLYPRYFMVPQHIYSCHFSLKKIEFLANLPFLAIPMGLFSCLKFEPLVQFVEKGKEINVSLYYESQ